MITQKIETKNELKKGDNLVQKRTPHRELKKRNKLYNIFVI